jgi:ArsR family transcriptional regulator, lead/cadmium/zinc/bismuth-responsive transcriptional repressor
MATRAAKKLATSLDEETSRHMAATFSAMGDANRIQILLLISGQERCVSDLAAELGISESAVSQHLRLLRSLRLVRPRRQGRNVFYALDDQHVEQMLRVCLEHVQVG